MNDFESLNLESMKSKINEDVEIFYYSKTDSTNTRARKMLEQCQTGDFIVFCNEQTGGRGRQGKSFYSPANTGVYMSVVVHPMSSLNDAVAMTTLASVAVCKALERITNEKLQIKWVNDIYYKGKKVCGILTEAVTDYKTQIVTSMIIGVGVNIKTRDFPKDVKNATCLDVDVKHSDIIVEISKELLKIKDGKIADYIDYYRDRSMLTKKEIIFIDNSHAVSATVLGIDDSGGLTVRLNNGEVKTLRSGEITVREKKNYE